MLPFGIAESGGVNRVITPEYARKFRLPHFKPAIKLGSHDDTTPAGGHIVGLEVRDDGLYAIPEFNEEGMNALEKGAFRYNSPEIIWDGGGILDSTTGKMIPGPLILGDALLHIPAFGEGVALYSVETTPMGGEGEQIMENENVTVPKGMWDVFTAWFKGKVEKPEVEPVVPEPVQPAPPAQPAPEETEQYQAVIAERDDFKAKYEAMEAERARTARVENFAAQLKETKVESGAEMLAAMSDEQAAWVIQHFKALSAQVAESVLLGERGTDAPSDQDPKTALSSAIDAYIAEHKVSYPAAVEALTATRPELFKIYTHQGGD